MDKHSDQNNRNKASTNGSNNKKVVISHLPLPPLPSPPHQPIQAKPNFNKVHSFEQNINNKVSRLPEPQPHLPLPGLKLPRNSTFSNQLLTTILPLVLAPLAFAGALFWGISNYQTAQRTELKLRNDAIVSANLAGDLIDDAVKTTSSLAENPLIINTARETAKRAEAAGLTKLPASQLETNFAATKLFQSTQILNYYLNQNAKKQNFSQLLFTERHGFNIAASGTVENFVQSNNEWWQKAQTEDFWTSTNLDQNKNLKIELSKAIKDPISGEFLGVVKGVMNANSFNELGTALENIGLNNSEKIQIIAPVSQAVISTIAAKGEITEHELIGGEIVLQKATALLAERQAQKTAKITPGEKPVYVAKREQLQGLTIIPFGDDKGQLVLTTSFDHNHKKYTLTTVPGIDFVSVTSIDSSELGTASNGLVFLLIFIALGAATTGITIALTRRWSKDLDELTEVSEQLAAGDLDIYVEPRGTSETQNIAQSFNTLAGQFKELLTKQEIEAQRAQLFIDIATTAREGKNIEAVFNKAVQGIQQFINSERVFVYRFNHDWSGEIVAEAAMPGVPSCMRVKVIDTYFTASDVGVNLYSKGRTYIINDIYQTDLSSCHLELYEQLQIRANLVTPIVSGDKLLGLICTQQCTEPRIWQQAEIDFCLQVSTQVGVALDRSSYLEQKEAEAQRSQLLAEIATSARSAKEIDALFTKVVQGAQKLLNAERVSVYRFNPDWSGKIVAEAATPGVPPCLNITVTDTYFTDSNEGVERYQQGRVLVINDIYEADLAPCHLEVYEHCQIRSIVVTPIIGGDKLLGLLCTQQYSAPRNWQELEINFCKQLATQVGLVLDRVNFFEQKAAEAKYQQLEAQRSQLFTEVANSANNPEDVETIFSKAVQGLQKLLQAERVSVYRFNSDWSGRIVTEAAAIGVPSCLNMTITDSYFTDSDRGVELYRHGRHLVINDVYQANLTPCHLQVYERCQIRSVVVTPIVGGGQLLGLLCTQQYSAARVWQPSEIALCTQLSTQIGLALDRINYFQQKETEIKLQEVEARLREAETQKQGIEAKQAQLFADITNTARQAGDVGEVFKKAVQGIQQLLETERVSIYRFNPDWSGEIVAEAAAVGVPPCLNMTVADSYFTDSDVGVELYRNGRVFTIDDVYTANLTPCHLDVYKRLKIRSIIITPIVGGDKLLGLLCTQQYSTPRTWQPSEIALCTQLSTQLGLALDRISYLEQKEAEAKKQEIEAKQAQLFVEIASSARQATDIDALFAKAVQGTQQLLNAERVSVYRFNPDWSGEIVAEAVAVGVPPCLNMTVADSYFTDSDLGVERYRNGRVFVINDIYEVNLTPCHLDVYKRLKIRAIVITPIVGGDKLLGLMCTQQYSTPRTWQQSEINFCTQLATQVGLALDRINYFEQKEAEAKKQEIETKQAQLFAEIASSARQAEDIDTVFTKAVQGTQRLLNAERVSVYRFNPDWSGEIVAEALAVGVPPCLNMTVADSYFTDSDMGVERYRNGRVFVVNDIYSTNLTPCHLDVYKRLQIRAVVITPIVGGDKLLGLMCTQQYSTPRTWQQSEINFCTQLATQVGLALDRINYFEQKEAEAKKQEIEAKQAQLFADIASSARQAEDIDALFAKAVQGTQQLLNAERVSVYRFNPDWSGEIVAEALAVGVPPCLNMTVADSYFTDSDMGVERYRNGRVFVINDIYSTNLTPCHLDVYKRLQIRAVVITPIVGGDKLLGLMCTQQYSTPRTWQQSEINFCTQLATQVGLALDRINYFEQKEIEARKQEIEAKQAQLFADIANSARQAEDIDALFARAVQGTQQLLNAERVSVYRFNPDWSGEIVAEASAIGVPPCLNMTVADSYFTDSDMGVERYRNGRVFVINDIYGTNLTPCHLDVYKRLQIRAVVITPIVGGDKLLGLMCTQQYSTPRTWQQSEINFCTQLATQVGLALDRINYFEQKEAEAKKQEVETKQAQLFAEIASSARQAADIDTLFAKAVQGTQQLLDAERVSVYRFNPDWSGEIVAEALAEGVPPCLNMTVADSYFTDSDMGVERYRNGRVFVINDIYTTKLTPCHLDVYKRLKIRAVVITPIVGGDKLLGLMCTQQYSTPRTWQQSEINFCTQLATQVGLALDRINYFEQKEAEAKKQEVEAKQAQLLAEIANSARRAADIEVLFTKAVRGTQQLLNAERVSVYRFNPDWSGEIVAEASAIGVPPCLNMTVADSYFTDSDMGVERYRNGRVFVINDIYGTNLTPCHLDVYKRLQIRAVVITPIVGGDKLLGLMCTQQYSTPRTWQQSEINFCTQLATQVGLALDRINYFEQKEAEAKKQEVEAQRAQLFAEIANSARESQDVKEIFNKAVYGAKDLLNAERVFLYRFNPDWSGNIVAEALSPGLPSCLNMKVTDTYFTESDIGVERYRNGRVFVINNIYEANLNPCHIELYERLKLKANVITPIVSGDKLLGLLCTQQCSAPRVWQQSEVDFCTQLSTQIGLALDRINYLEQKEAEAKRSQLLSTITLRLRESLNLEDILNTAVEEVRYAFYTDRVIIYRFDADWDGVVVAESVASGWMPTKGVRIVDTCLKETQGGSYNKGRVRAIEDIYDAGLTECHVKMLERLQIKANLVVPIIVDNHLYGLMILQQCSGTRAWQKAEIDLCTQLGTQVGIALNQATLVEQIEKSRQEAEVVSQERRLFSDITLKIRQSLKLEDILNTAVTEVRQALKTDRVMVYRFDSEWNGVVIAESVANAWMPIKGVEIEDSCLKGAHGGMYKTGRIRAIEDIYEAGLTDCHVKMLERFQIKANLVVPILVDKQLFGLMIANHCASTRVWQKAEIDLFTQLATQVGIALNQATLLEQIEKSRQEAEIISQERRLFADITLRIRQSLRLEDILNTAVTEVRQAIKTDRVMVYRFDPDWNGKIIAESVASGWIESKGIEIEDTCLKGEHGGLYKTGRVRVIEDIYNAGLTECHVKLLERFQIKANLVVPILVDKQLFGLMIANQCVSTRVWQKAEVDLFTQLATQVGIALNQATLVDQIQTLLASQEEATRQQAENAEQQRLAKEALQRRALELLMEVDPVSKGDLTIRAKVTEDEIGTIADSYNATITSLRKIVAQVQTATKQVASTTINSEVSVQELSTEALRQAEEILAALDRIQQMSGSIRAVATNADQAEAAVQEATQLVKEGDIAMNRTVDGILAIRETVAETSKKVKRLGESSQKISKVVNLISTFAAQTNLLALNASIEAARAGEEGRGFAVVADEVRSLARQSAAATAEIEKLVAGIQSETNEVVAAMEAGTEQVVTGTQLVEEARHSLNKITAASDRISALVEAIAQAAAVQSQASDSVTHTMSNVAEIANKTSTGATELSTSFQELLALAQELEENVGQFKVS